MAVRFHSLKRRPTESQMMATRLQSPHDEKNNPAGDDKGKAWSTKSNQNLLIEYFEGGKLDAPSRPSVRVKVTPSSRTKSGEDIKITEYTGERAASYTRRISLTKPTAATSNDILGTKNLGEQLDNAMASYGDATVSSRGEGWD